MPRRPLSLLTLTLLWAALWLVSAQILLAPGAATSTEAVLVASCSADGGSAADPAPEEPEPLPVPDLGAHTRAGRVQWRMAAPGATPLRAPDTPLRPPTARPRV